MQLGGAAQQLAHLLVRRWKKFRYHCPTAQKGSGVKTQTTRSTSASNSEHVEDEAMGTATTICAGAFFRKAGAATRNGRTTSRAIIHQDRSPTSSPQRHRTSMRTC